MPEVSVIIPTYNSAKYLTDAVDSVLRQTHRDFEVLVIDDGSTDDTPAVIGRYGDLVRYIRQPNSGVAAARNRGINESMGRYVAFLDADDTWHRDKLKAQIAALRKNPGYLACYTAFTVVSQDLRPLHVIRNKRVYNTLEDLLLRGNVIGSICTVLYERSLFDVVGGFDDSLSQCADWDMWVRIAGRTEFLYLDLPLATYRQHDTNMSRDAGLLERDSVRVLEKGFSMSCLDAAVRGRRRAASARNYMVLAGTYFHAGSYGDFVRCAVRAVALDLRQSWRLIGFPVRAVRRLRRLQPGHSA
ncbi:MAG TPA: glycosyltransferase [Blastocatellia bacterium]|nr:glycosyltransferase [Blastocatellia bacterium]